MPLKVIDGTQHDKMIRECLCGAALTFHARDPFDVECDCGERFNPFGQRLRRDAPSLESDFDFDPEGIFD